MPLTKMVTSTVRVNKPFLFLKEVNWLSYTFIDRKREALKFCLHLHGHRVPALPQNTSLHLKSRV